MYWHGIYNKRLRRIMDLLLEDTKPVDTNRLALTLKVSTKTVRADMRELEELLLPIGVQVNLEKGSGYSLRIETTQARTRMETLIKQFNDSELKENLIPSDPEERRQYIISLLLLNELEHEKVIRFYDLADI
ncbi:MAG: HTH domain-containing protein [Lachnospiraceae bacterium]